MRFAPCNLLVLALALACGDGEPAEPTAGPCDPFAASAEVQVEYFASLPSGELLLVTSLPDNADYYGSFRLFYGEPAAVSEHEILTMRRGRDGGSTTLDFELDGTPVTLSFPVEFDGMQFMPGAWTFELPDETIPLERLSSEADADLLASAQFECLG
jgi:hypothetical protein